MLCQLAFLAMDAHNIWQSLLYIDCNLFWLLLLVPRSPLFSLSCSISSAGAINLHSGLGPPLRDCVCSLCQSGAPSTAAFKTATAATLCPPLPVGLARF